MSWFWTIIFLCFTFNITFSDARHHRKLPSATIVGTVYCHSCIHQLHSIPGASVAVECKGTASRPAFHQEVKTNSHGEFTLHLPVPVSRHDKKINGCSVKVIRSNNAACTIAIPATAVSSSLQLKSRQHNKHIFSAGFFTFKPQQCDQKQSFNDPEFLPQLPQLPPLPRLPQLPPLPSLPPLPPLPFFGPAQLPLPINPLQPPPTMFPPVIPSPPPPPTFPPILPTPPISFPSIPGLIPSPSPPPLESPSFPVPTLPPFPFQPTPGFPAAPPASDPTPSKSSKPQFRHYK